MKIYVKMKEINGKYRLESKRDQERKQKKTLNRIPVPSKNWKFAESPKKERREQRNTKEMKKHIFQDTYKTGKAKLKYETKAEKCINNKSENKINEELYKVKLRNGEKRKEIQEHKY